MPRIVAGVAKGRRLLVAPKGTRPTSERAREALFSSLATLIDLAGSRVLDLFAGTGAVGLEALSRGAACATFVESNANSWQLLRRNIGAVGVPDAVAVRETVESFLGSARADSPYDLVFADPPYVLDDEALASILDLVGSDRWLAPHGVVVVERGGRSGAPSWPTVIEPIRERRYGDSVLWYGRRR